MTAPLHPVVTRMAAGIQAALPTAPKAGSLDALTQHFARAAYVALLEDGWAVVSLKGQGGESVA